MALNDYVERVRSILTGYGLGEKPVIVQVAADAVNTVSGQTVAVTVASGEVSARNITAGDVLSTYAPDTEDNAWVGYVLSANGTTDVVTCVNGYGGATAIAATATTHDAGLLYLHADGTPTDFEIINAVNTVFTTLLAPHLLKTEFDTEASPSMSTLRVDLDADVYDIDEAWQIIGPDRIDIAFDVERVGPSEATPATAGVVGRFDLFNSSTLYLKTLRKFAIGDEATYGPLVEVVATAAAAISAGWTRPETTLAISKQDSRDRGRAPDVGAALWRDFFTLRTEWADELARDRADEILIDRG